MRVDVADTPPIQAFVFDEPEYLAIGGNRSLRQSLQRAEDQIPLPQIAERQFAQNKRMPENLILGEQGTQPLVGRSQMIDPDRCVDQAHLAFARRRGTGLRRGSVPPRRASLRAASRCTNARSASRISADFSRIPV